MADALVHPYKVSKRVLSNATEQLGEFVKAFPLKRMKIRKGKKRVLAMMLRQQQILTPTVKITSPEQWLFCNLAPKY